MTDTLIVPCVDCICIPICRHKTYHNLYWQCAILKDYLQNDPSIHVSFKAVYKAIKPSTWHVHRECELILYEKRNG